jgi:hypothetical protein
MVNRMELHGNIQLGGEDMLNADFSDRTYTAEVMKTEMDGIEAFKGILRLTLKAETESQTDPSTGSIVKISHGFLSSKLEYHRFARTITLADGKEITIPRPITIRGQQCNLYDVFIAQCRHHTVVAVPFHDLAEEFFPRVDDSLGGTNTCYEKLNITALVMRLGASGATKVLTRPSGDQIGLSLTRCHLAYADQDGRTSNLQQIRMTGANLGASKEYRSLVAPVLNPHDSTLTVTPIILGFAHSANGVRKSSATTDRHGNFKIWIAPGLRRLIRLFELLGVLETMKDVTESTNNVPILQSKTIRDAED